MPNNILTNTNGVHSDFMRHLGAHAANSPSKITLLKRALARMFGISTVLLLCAVGIAAISYSILMPQSLRLDEAQSLWQTNRTLSGTLQVVANDVHVPLYHLLLHLWQTYLGNGIETARLFSLIIFIATIPLFYLLARTILTLRWALLATVFFSFSPFMNWYGSEIRMYSLLALLSVLSQLFYIRILQKNTGYIGYAITAVLGVYTHYFFFFTLATQIVFFLANRGHFKSSAFKKFFAIAVLTLVSFAPWLYYFMQNGAAENTSPLLSSPSSFDFFNAFSQFAFGFQNDHVNTILLSCWPLIVLFGFFAVRKNLRIPPTVVYLLMAGVMPVVLAYVVSLTVTPFFLSRYMVSVVAPLTLVVVWFISNYSPRFRTGLVLLFGVITIFASYQQYTSAQTPVKEDYRSAAQLISREAGPQDIIALSAPFTVYPFSYYYDGNAQIKTLPLWDRTRSGAIPAFNKNKLPAEVQSLAADHQYIYVLLSQDQGYEKDIAEHFRNNFELVKSQQFSPGLKMYVYKAGYSSVPPLY